MIPLAKPYFDEHETEAIDEVMASGMVSQGKKVEEFEEIVRKYTGTRFACAVSSCTAGLYLALRNKVDLWNCNVAIPAFTFPAAQECVKHFGGEMAIEHVDLDKDTYNVDTNELESTIRSIESHGGIWDKVEAVIPIHQFGLPCNMSEINKIAQEHDLFVLEDAACALGSEYKGTRIGKHGTAVFSFHGRKIITTGEGGMVCTDDENLYEAILEGRQFGRNSHGEFHSSGLNFKMSDIQAAIGIEQMEKLPEILSLRYFVANTYNELLYPIEERSLLHNPTDFLNRPEFREYLMGNCKTNWQSYVIRLPSYVNRDLVIQKMKKANIECQVGSYDNSGGSCPVSSELAATTLALPIWPGMTEKQIEYIVGVLETCLT